MFESTQLENKTMINKLVYVKNNGNVIVNGLPPGRSMPLDVNAEGKPLDRAWRRLTRRQSADAVLQLSKTDPNKIAAPAREAKAKTNKTKSTNKGE